MSIKDVRLFLVKLFNTSRNMILFRINGYLTSLSIITESNTVDSLRMKYGNWYNHQLMRKFIECDYYIKDKHIRLYLDSMETLGNIIIMKVHYLGMTSEEMNEYLTYAIGNSIPNSAPNIQISNTGSNHAKIVFPL